jgi:hypothetical protein
VGFVWKKAQRKRLFLIERADIFQWRLKFLTQMKQARTEGREIFYLHESWVDTNLTFQKCWQNKGDVEGVMSTGSATNRLIIVHIVSKNGFLPDCFLMYVQSRQDNRRLSRANEFWQLREMDYGTSNSKFAAFIYRCDG